jgi:hypothetical protein
MKKLTLSVDEDVIREAKRIAAEQNTSVSAMFSRFVQAMAHDAASGTKLGPLTRRLTGVARLPEGASAQDVLNDALLDREGLGGS